MEEALSNYSDVNNNDLDNSREWLSIREASDLSGYHPEWLRNLLRTGKLKGNKFADVWAVNRYSLIAYLKEAGNSEDMRRGPKP